MTRETGGQCAVPRAGCRHRPVEPLPHQKRDEPDDRDGHRDTRPGEWPGIRHRPRPEKGGRTHSDPVVLGRNLARLSIEFDRFQLIERHSEEKAVRWHAVEKDFGVTPRTPEVLVDERLHRTAADPVEVVAQIDATTSRSPVPFGPLEGGAQTPRRGGAVGDNDDGIESDGLRCEANLELEIVLAFEYETVGHDDRESQATRGQAVRSAVENFESEASILIGEGRGDPDRVGVGETHVDERERLTRFVVDDHAANDRLSSGRAGRGDECEDGAGEAPDAAFEAGALDDFRLIPW